MIVIGVLLGFAGDITSGEVLAFAFLVSLFVGPVQFGTQVLTDAQNAIAGWRRVIGILETPADLVDPGPDGAVLPRGPIDVRFEHVDFAYPDGPLVLRDVDLEIASGTRLAIVGETGSGKSTFAKLLTRLMDPTSGSVLLDGVDVREIAQTSLRQSVVLVPQEGFLFDDTLAANLRYGELEATDEYLLFASMCSASPTGWPACPTGSRRRSASAVSRCRRGSGSSSPSCAPRSPIPTCSSSTRPPRRSTRSWRCGSARPSSG